MRLMGIKDPNRYVVGNSLNSINPLTGQPEFFFKRVFRAIRRVVKKIAPIVVPIIGNMIAPGIGGPDCFRFICHKCYRRFVGRCP